MKYAVWYMRPDHFAHGIMGDSDPDPERLSATHIHLKDVEADNLDAAFSHMQGHHWSPNGEACDLIEAKGLAHTSMSVGDILVDPDGNVFQCANVGWRHVKPEPWDTDGGITNEDGEGSEAENDRWATRTHTRD